PRLQPRELLLNLRHNPPLFGEWWDGDSKRSDVSNVQSRNGSAKSVLVELPAKNWRTQHPRYIPWSDNLGTRANPDRRLGDVAAIKTWWHDGNFPDSANNRKNDIVRFQHGAFVFPGNRRRGVSNRGQINHFLDTL